LSEEEIRIVEYNIIRGLKKMKKCLKEWNATIEALGQSKQTILIRNYKTNNNEFLLYPTVSYALKDNYLESFQGKHLKFVVENSLPVLNKEGKKVLIKYFATLEKIIEKPVSMIPSDEHYIWTKNHVQKYMTGKTAFIWILRVYTLKEPYWAEPTFGAIMYANLKEEVSLEGMEPVLSDSELDGIVQAIESKK
jgi:restriction system protein